MAASQFQLVARIVQGSLDIRLLDFELLAVAQRTDFRQRPRVFVPPDAGECVGKLLTSDITKGLPILGRQARYAQRVARDHFEIEPGFGPRLLHRGNDSLQVEKPVTERYFGEQ